MLDGRDVQGSKLSPSTPQPPSHTAQRRTQLPNTQVNGRTELNVVRTSSSHSRAAYTERHTHKGERERGRGRNRRQTEKERETDRHGQPAEQAHPAHGWGHKAARPRDKQRQRRREKNQKQTPGESRTRLPGPKSKPFPEAPCQSKFQSGPLHTADAGCAIASTPE